MNSFLFATLLFDIAFARTIWFRVDDYANLKNVMVIVILVIAAVVVKAIVLFLEAYEKRSMLRKEYASYPPEATGSIFSRSFFWWLNPLFRSGFRRVLDVDDLFSLDKHLKSAYCHPRFQTAWASGETDFLLSHTLLSPLFTSCRLSPPT